MLSVAVSESAAGHPFPPMSDRWAAILRGEHPLRFAQRAGRRAFALAPGSTRCKLCNAPFTGPSAAAFRICGYGQSRKNSQLCARCVESAPEGGAVVPLSILFADMRGYTSLTERLGTIEATALVNRFYEVASKAFLPFEGLLGQIAGDEGRFALHDDGSKSGYDDRADPKDDRNLTHPSTARTDEDDHGENDDADVEQRADPPGPPPIPSRSRQYDAFVAT